MRTSITSRTKAPQPLRRALLAVAGGLAAAGAGAEAIRRRRNERKLRK